MFLLPFLTAICSIALNGIQASPKSQFPKFHYIEGPDIEPLIANSTNFFILFFDKRDGLTEDSHRVFLESKVLLETQHNIKIEVYQHGGPLRQKLENQLKIFSFPKFKFFQKGKPPQTFDGSVNKAFIANYVKKMNREKPVDSLPLGGFDELQNLFGGDRQTFVIYYGNLQSKDFKLYNDAFRLQNIRFYHTTSCFLYKYLTLLELTSDVDLVANNFNDTLKGYNRTELEAFVIIKAQELDPRRAKCQNMVFHVQKFRYADILAVLVNSESEFGISELRNFAHSKDQTIFDSAYQIKKFIPNSNPNEDVRVLAVLLKKENSRNISSSLREFVKEGKIAEWRQKSNKNITVDTLEKATFYPPVGGRYQLAIITVYDIIEASQKDVFNNHEESIFALEIKKQKVTKKHKINLDFQKPFLPQFREFIRRDAANEVPVFFVSKPKELITFKDDLFEEITAENFNSKVFSKSHNSMVIFYTSVNQDLMDMIGLVKKYTALVQNMKYFLCDFYGNELSVPLEQGTLPYLRIYYAGDPQNQKGMQITKNEGAYVSFLKDIILNSEL